MSVGRSVSVLASQLVTLNGTHERFLVACYATLHPALSVRWSVRHTQVVMLELKTRKALIYDAAVGTVCVQRYYDPASLVFLR